MQALEMVDSMLRIRCCILCLYLLAFVGNGYAKQTQATQSVALELQAIKESKEFGNYCKAISLTKDFLTKNLNTSVCNYNTFVELLETLRYCSEMEGMTSDYRTYKYTLLEQLNPIQQGTFIRILSYISCDEKSYSDIALIDRFKGKISQETISRDSFIPIWFDLLKSEIYLANDSLDKASYYVSKAMHDVESSIHADSSSLVLVMMVQEKLYASQFDYKKCIEIASKIARIIESSNKDSRELYATYARLQSYAYQQKDYSAAVAYGEKALVRESVFQNTPFFSRMLIYNGGLKNRSFLDDAMTIDFVKVHLSLSDCFFQMGDVEKAAFLARKTLFKLSKEIYQSYGEFAFNMASDELRRKVDVLVRYAPLYAARVGNDSIIQSVAYNASLIHKQLTLNADFFFRNLVYEYRNPTLIDRYHELGRCVMLLDDSKNTDTDSLLHRISVLKKNLQRNVLLRQTKEDAYSQNWTDVRNALKKGEVAIEFSIASNEKEGDIYLANIISSDSNYPQSIRLCSENRLSTIKDIYKTTEAYNILWKPIETFVKDKKKIYFSPIGKLYQIGIEHLPVGTSGKTFSEIYEVSRLSSTRELIKKDSLKNGYNNAVLFGGIEYDVRNASHSETAMAQDVDNVSFKDQIDLSELRKRAGFEYLPATKEEVEQISSLLKTARKNYSIHLGAEATEQVVKGLDGENIGILHIATHGFNIQSTRNRLGRIVSSDDSHSTFEEQSLSRSGLLFAGAYNTVQNYQKKADKKDDGILTAKEISRINLASVDMVVLSACETGLGTISNEGIYGLQRGLKRAGAGCIVMSLWKVDDDATSLFMTSFYKFLTEGLTKQQSFVLAQNAVKSESTGKYKDPEYWAAFVMLDGIK